LPDTPALIPAGAAILLGLLATVLADRAADNGYDLRERVSVWRHGKVGRELDALDDCLASACLIAHASRDLKDLGKSAVFPAISRRQLK